MQLELKGSEGRISVRVWDHPGAHRIVVISHGYGEHIERYDHVARALRARGAAVYGPDHLGHGLSAGERVLIRDVEHVVDDLVQVIERARADHPGRPVVLLGHSMGGLIATRLAQRAGRPPLAGLVLSGHRRIRGVPATADGSVHRTGPDHHPDRPLRRGRPRPRAGVRRRRWRRWRAHRTT